MNKRVFSNGVDITTKALDFTTEAVSLNLSTGQFLQFEAYKPFKRVHVEIGSAVTANIKVEYYNGAWIDLPCEDYTFSFKKSGFLKFVPPADWISLNSFYPIRISFDSDIVTNLKGINFLFSNDDDLKEEIAFFDVYLQKMNTSSLVVLHQGAMKQIIDELNRSGATNKATKNRLTDLDFLIPEELQQASKFLTLSKLFFEISDAVDDKYYQKYKDYEALYSSAKNTYYLTLDENDDGIIDNAEKNKIRTITVTRL